MDRFHGWLPDDELVWPGAAHAATTMDVASSAEIFRNVDIGTSFD
jgi:hypothetical protein